MGSEQFSGNNSVPPQRLSLVSPNKNNLSLIAALATMLVWGVNFAFVKHVLESIGVETFLFIRFVSLPLLGFALLVVIFRNRLASTWPRRPDLARFLVCGLVGHALHIGVVMYGMDLSTPFSSSLVLTSGPLFTLIILALLGVERLRLRQVAGTLVALAGIVVFLAQPKPVESGLLGAEWQCSRTAFVLTTCAPRVQQAASASNKVALRAPKP